MPETTLEPQTETDLKSLAQEMVTRAMQHGATAAECVIREGDEFSTLVRLGQVETLKESGSKAIGVRVFFGKRSASTHSSDFSRAGLDRMSSPGLGLSGAPQPAIANAVVQKLRAERVVKAGASWFITVGVLSIINSVLAMSGTGFHFIFGLGVTELVDVLAHQIGQTGFALDLVINGFVTGVFVLFWHFARKGQRWAFLVGMDWFISNLLGGVKLLVDPEHFAEASRVLNEPASQNLEDAD